MHPSFLQLAGPKLQSLNYVAEMGKEGEGVPDVNAIAGLRGMTRLELSYFISNANLSALQGLKLQELVLINCPGAAAAILASGSMSSLQKLHILDRVGLNKDEFNALEPHTDDHLKALVCWVSGGLRASQARAGFAEIAQPCASLRDVKAFHSWHGRCADCLV